MFGQGERVGASSPLYAVSLDEFQIRSRIALIYLEGYVKRRFDIGDDAPLL